MTARRRGELAGLLFPHRVKGGMSWLSTAIYSITSMQFPSSDARGRGPPIRPRTGSNQAPEPTRWPPLPRQSRDRGVMHGHGSSDGTAAFAGLETLEGLGLL